MNDNWRLLDTGSQPAAYNMALNKVLVESRSNNIAPNTLRFLDFKPNAALVGYHQAINLEIDEKYCRQHGIDINRRMTGGGAIYMDEGQLGWEIFALKSTPGIPGKTEDLYRKMCDSAILGLKQLGISANFRPQNDIEVDGRKISGSGGTEIGEAFLFHGSLLVDFDVDTMIKCLKLPIQKLQDKQLISFKERVVSIREVLGYVPTLDVIKNAFVKGFEETLGINFQPGSLNPEEEALLGKYLPMFESDDWIYGKRTIDANVLLSTVDYKTNGGLIRINLSLDLNREIIKTIFITGDFFAYPTRSILDLEANLKNASCLTEDIKINVNEFFKHNLVTIPGVKPEDFINAILMAIERAKNEVREEH